jgi:hypothetical protein
VKKSYSLGDLSTDNAALDYHDGRRGINEEDDDIDNRLIAERYNAELPHDQTDGRGTRRSGHHGVKAHEAGIFNPPRIPI